MILFKKNSKIAQFRFYFRKKGLVSKKKTVLTQKLNWKTTFMNK